jgi:hypothetical protein
MAVKQFLLLSNGLLALGFFIAATITDDRQKEQTRLLYAIWFTGWIAIQMVGAIGIHVGAFPIQK